MFAAVGALRDQLEAAQTVHAAEAAGQLGRAQPGLAAARAWRPPQRRSRPRPASLIDSIIPSQPADEESGRAVAVGAQLQAARVERRGEARREGAEVLDARAAGPPRRRGRRAAPRPGPRSRGGRSCRSRRPGCRPGRSARAAPRSARRWTSARRSIAFGDLRQRASGREARAPRSEQGASSRTRSKPGAISSSAASASITVTLRRPSRRACPATSAARLGVELDRDHLAAVAHPRRDLAGLDPRAGAEVEDVLARPAGRAPRPRRPSRGSAGSARRPRPASGTASPVRPSITIVSGAASGHSASAALAPRRPASRSSASTASRSARRRVRPASPPRPARCRRRAASGRRRRRAPPTTSAPARAAPSGRPRRASGVESSPSSAAVSSARSRAARRSTALTRPAAWAAPAPLTSSTAWSTAAWSGVASAKSSS